MDNDKFYGNYRAKVLATDETANDGASQYGRLKVEVYPMLIGVDTAKTLSKTEGIDVDGIETADLPWCVPAYPLATGSGLYQPDTDTQIPYGCCIVPDVGTYVWVFFEAGDIYQPVYFAEAPTALYGLPTRRRGPDPDNDDDADGNHYPDRRVLKFKRGAAIWDDHAVTDSATDILPYDAYAGDEGVGGGELILKLDKDLHLDCGDSEHVRTGRDVTVTVKRDIVEVAGRDKTITITRNFDITVQGNVTMNVVGTVSIDAEDNVTIHSDNDVNITSDGDVNIN